MYRADGRLIINCLCQRLLVFLVSLCQMFSHLNYSSMLKNLRVAALVMLLWQGPIPVGHSHECIGDSAVASDQLVRHLTTYHRSDCLQVCSLVPEDWHIHWVLPANGYVGLHGEELVVSNDIAHSLGCHDVLDFTTQSAKLEYIRDWRDRLTTSVEAQAVPHSFIWVGALNCRLSLPELVGVRLC
jgi:hypothetical protein